MVRERRLEAGARLWLGSCIRARTLAQPELVFELADVLSEISDLPALLLELELLAFERLGVPLGLLNQLLIISLQLREL